jgi:sugar lactone lactonase YvrE
MMMMMQLVAAISLVFYSSPTSAAQSLRQVDKRAVDVIIATFTGISDGHYGGVDIHSSGDIYLGDYQNKVIKHIDGRTGVTSIIAGTGHEEYNGDGLPSLSTNICSPLGVAVDESRNVYFTDFDNNRVRMISSSTGLVTTVVGTGEAGYNGDGFSSSSATLTNPVGVALDGQGNLYVADSGNHRVRRVDLSSLEISTVAGTDQIGYNGDDIAATSATLNSPHSIAFDPVGNIYFTDRLNHRIRKINSETGVISTVAGTGVAGYSSNDVVATSAMLHLPRGIAFDESANLYIEDGEDNRVRNINAATGIMTTLFQKDSTSYKLERIPAIFATMTSPSDLEESSSGSLFVTEHYLKTVSLSRVQDQALRKSNKFVPSASPVQHRSSHSKKTHASGEHNMNYPLSPMYTATVAPVIDIPTTFSPYTFPDGSPPVPFSVDVNPFQAPTYRPIAPQSYSPIPPHGDFFPDIPTYPPYTPIGDPIPAPTYPPYTPISDPIPAPTYRPIAPQSSPPIPPHGDFFPISPQGGPSPSPSPTYADRFPTKAPVVDTPPNVVTDPPTTPPLVVPNESPTAPQGDPFQAPTYPPYALDGSPSPYPTYSPIAPQSFPPIPPHGDFFPDIPTYPPYTLHGDSFPPSEPPLETGFPTCGYPVSPPTDPTNPPTCGVPTTVPTRPTSPPTCGLPTRIPTVQRRRRPTRFPTNKRSKKPQKKNSGKRNSGEKKTKTKEITLN